MITFSCKPSNIQEYLKVKEEIFDNISNELRHNLEEYELTNDIRQEIHFLYDKDSVFFKMELPLEEKGEDYFINILFYDNTLLERQREFK